MSSRQGDPIHSPETLPWAMGQASLSPEPLPLSSPSPHSEFENFCLWDHLLHQEGLCGCAHGF